MSVQRLVNAVTLSHTGTAQLATIQPGGMRLVKLFVMLSYNAVSGTTGAKMSLLPAITDPSQNLNSAPVRYATDDSSTVDQPTLAAPVLNSTSGKYESNTCIRLSEQDLPGALEMKWVNQDTTNDCTLTVLVESL